MRFIISIILSLGIAFFFALTAQANNTLSDKSPANITIDSAFQSYLKP